MDFLPQSTEEKRNENEQNSQIPEPGGDCCEKEIPVSSVEKNNGSNDQTDESTTKNDATSSTVTTTEIPPAHKQDDTIPRTSSQQEQTSQSETENYPENSQTPHTSLADKSEVAPVTTLQSCDDSLKLECLQGDENVFRNKSAPEKEESGSTTVNVNSDGNLKIEKEFLRPFSNTSVQNEASRSSCSGKSSERESIQERVEGVESSLHANASDNKSLQSGSCVNTSNKDTNILEKDFILDSKKVTIVSTESNENCSVSDASENRKDDYEKIVNYENKSRNYPLKNEVGEPTESSRGSEVENVFAKTEAQNDLSVTTSTPSSDVKQVSSQSPLCSNNPTANACKPVVFTDSTTRIVKTEESKVPKATQDSNYNNLSSNTNEDTIVSSTNTTRLNMDKKVANNEIIPESKSNVGSKYLTKSSQENSGQNPSGISLVPTKDNQMDRNQISYQMRGSAKEYEKCLANYCGPQTSVQGYQPSTKDFVTLKSRDFHDQKGSANFNVQQGSRENSSSHGSAYTLQSYVVTNPGCSLYNPNRSGVHSDRERHPFRKMPENSEAVGHFTSEVTRVEEPRNYYNDKSPSIPVSAMNSYTQHHDISRMNFATWHPEKQNLPYKTVIDVKESRNEVVDSSAPTNESGNRKFNTNNSMHDPPQGYNASKTQVAYESNLQYEVPKMSADCSQFKERESKHTNMAERGYTSDYSARMNYNLQAHSSGYQPAHTGEVTNYSSTARSSAQASQPNYAAYVSHPDYSKQVIQKTATTPSVPNNDLSQLHMKPPDFSKMSSGQTSVPASTTKPKDKTDFYKQGTPQVTQQNFAEISKKYNYISDLRLKNPGPVEERPAALQHKSLYNNLYVKAPDFSTDKFKNKITPEKSPSQEYYYASKRDVETDPSSKYVQCSENPYARQFPQLSHDVELSIVPSKTNSYPTDTRNLQEKLTSPHCGYQNYSRSNAYSQEVPGRQDDKGGVSKTPNEQQQIQRESSQNRNVAPNYVPPFPNNTHLQPKDQFQQQVTQKSNYLPTADVKAFPRQSQVMQEAVAHSESSRYNKKVQPNTFQQDYQSKAYYNNQYPQSQSSVIQNSKSKEHYPDYSYPVIQNQAKTPEYSPRQVHNHPYYNIPPQSTPPHSSSASKTPSPSPMLNARPYPNQMQQSISTSPSPACQSAGPYKTTPSPGMMNPPFGWPSQSTSKTAQSSSSSPHALHRFSKSPLNANAPSPQSPSFLQPSPKPSPSPTHLSRPSPQAQNISMNYKNPYSSPQNPVYYQQSDPSKSTNVNSFVTKGEKPVEQVATSQVAHMAPQYRQVDPKQDFRSAEYQAQMCVQKPPVTKRVEYPDHNSSVRKNEQMKNYKCPPLSEHLPVGGRQEYPLTSSKSLSDFNFSKNNQKPNYREMINHVYAIRNATSETDLNVEIIKRTLKKDISTRRSDNDLSKSIFDVPTPTKNCNYYTKSAERLPTLKTQYEEVKRVDNYHAKYNTQFPYDPNKSASYDNIKVTTTEYSERKSSLPACNELVRNDISVTVSKIIRSPQVDSRKPAESITHNAPSSSYTQNKDFSNVIISRIPAAPNIEQTSPTINAQRPKESGYQQMAGETSKLSNSVFNPVKRESPLDLSVKTVKTKADSTGCDDISSYHSKTTASSSSLKVDFAPNFSKHTIGDNNFNASYESRQPTTASQSFCMSNRPDQRTSQPVSHMTTVEQKHSQGSCQYPIPHHRLPPSQYQNVPNVEQKVNSVTPNATTRLEQTYPVPLKRNSDNCSYQQNVPRPPHNVYVEQKLNHGMLAQQHPSPTRVPKVTHEQMINDQNLRSESTFQTPIHYQYGSKSSGCMSTTQLQKKEAENLKQVLNPSGPDYDKKFGEYVMNTPQRRSFEKLKDDSVSNERPTTQLPSQQFPGPLKQESAPMAGSAYPRTSQETIPIQNHANQRHIVHTNVQKQYTDLNAPYDIRYDSKDQFNRRMEVTKNHSAPAQNIMYNQYSHYTNPLEVPRSVDYKFRDPSKESELHNSSNTMYNRFREVEYPRKRLPDSLSDSAKVHQPPEKQVRVDELYRAHLEETYRKHQQQQQQRQQQQQIHSSQVEPVHAYERRDISVIQSKTEVFPKEQHFRNNCENFEYSNKTDYIRMEGFPVSNKQQVKAGQLLYPPHSQQQPWYPENHSNNKLIQHEMNTPKREPHLYYPQYNEFHMQSKDLDRSKTTDAKKQATLPIEISQKLPPPAPAPSSNNINRGADQNVISKLRTSIEMREYEKQRISMMQKQSSGENLEEDINRPDIASLLAARIRTKGELKGFTPLPAQATSSKPTEVEEEAHQERTETPKKSMECFSDDERNSAFDLLDWSSTCNDFVEQLLTGNSKKRGKRRKSVKSVTESAEKPEVKEAENLPGVEYNGDIDKSLVEQIKSEIEEPTDKPVKSEVQTGEYTSSDEDKPLLFLRQQSNCEGGLAATSDPDCKLPQETTLRSQDSDTSSAIKSNRSTLEKLSEKIVRNMREKQRMELEKRFAARLSKTSSSSDSESERKRNSLRPKKLVRKPRSRASAASNRELSETDSSESEEEIRKRSTAGSRIETRKRKSAQQLSDSASTSGSDEFSTKKVENNSKSGLSEARKEFSSASRKEIITKARVKCMRLCSDSSESEKENAKSENKIENVSHDNDDNSRDPSTVSPSKDQSEEESNAECTKSSPFNKTRSKKTITTRRTSEEVKIEETMTRSKKKREIEQQMANSKILRNEKIVQNIPVDRKLKTIEIRSLNKATKALDNKSATEEKPKPGSLKPKVEKSVEVKRKHSDDEVEDRKKRKTGKMVREDSSASLSKSSDSEDETVSDRVRSRRSRICNEVVKKESPNKIPKRAKSKEHVKESPNKKGLTKSTKKTPIKEPSEESNNTQKFPPGWELEVYQYKRSLKIPPSLITIKGPAHHRVSTSLPDLDPHSSDASETFAVDNTKKEFIKPAEESEKPPDDTKSGKKVKLKKEKEAESEIQASEEPKSIIDVLHSRVIKSKKVSKKISRPIHNNEPKLLPRGNNEAELLPTPAVKSDSKPPFKNERSNLFETEIFKSRTRTEYRILKNKELIREVFGGEDRPASAPPELPDIDIDIKVEPVTFDQKYQEYLQKMSVDFGEKIRKNRKPINTAENSNCKDNVPKNIKTEKLDEISSNLQNIDEETQYTELNACLVTPTAVKEEPQDANERDTVSIASERDGTVTPLIFKRKKGSKNRSGRRKGSSGFDYIRKKKKTPAASNTAQDGVKRKKFTPTEFFHTRDESDVSKEIQKWVLNKSVGQSALHKAARLGYLDVIAYCLERMGMNPDSKDNAGYTPLHEACAKGRIDIARVLLQYGANHSETAHSGIRPLHEASENGYIEIVRLLLSYGADPLLTTYSGQTPLMLAESPEMEQFLKNHLQDVQNTGPHKQPWKFPGPWKIYDPDECGFDVLADAPEPHDNEHNDSSVVKKTEDNSLKNQNGCETDLNTSPDLKVKSSVLTESEKNTNFKSKFKSISTKCTVLLDNIDSLDINSVKQFNNCHRKLISRRRSTFEKKESKGGRVPEESEGEGEVFEFEESDMPLPPLYLLKDEGSEKWVLLNDLCNLLKVKSKDTLLKQICPSIPPSTVNKELLRELKMSDFLEKATCLQLLCAGEKLNIRASKVVLVKYNESVRNLLGVKTILMKF